MFPMSIHSNLAPHAVDVQVVVREVIRPYHIMGHGVSMTKKLEGARQDYHEQVLQNESVFRDMVKTVRPDIWLLMDLLDSTKVNYLVLVKTLRHLYNIASGSKFGNVTIDVQNGIATFVRGEESDRLNEPILLPETESL